MITFFNYEKNLIPHIPADIFDRDRDSAWWDEDNIIYCCNWSNFAYHVEGDEIFLELMWVHEAPEGFSFSTYHMLDQALLSLLEAVRAINRFDGHANLLALSSYEYGIGFQKLDEGYIVTKIEPQDDSYHWNIKAFYDPVAVLSNLRDQAFRSARLPDASHCVTMEFSYPSEDELFYSPWIPEEMLEHERLRYDISSDTYSFSVNVGMVDEVDANFFYFYCFGVENGYNMRVENTDSFLHLLAKVGALTPDGNINRKSEGLYQATFKIILKKRGTAFKVVNLRLLRQDTDRYWEYLMQLAETEQKSDKR